MSASFRVDVSGFRDPSGRFAALSEQTRTAQRDEATELGDVLVRTAAEFSPVGVYPFGRPASAGPRFAASWQNRFEEHDSGGTLVVENVDPKANLVIQRTAPHLIAARRARVLRFGSPDAPIFRRVVHHPGTSGNDVPGRLALVAQPAAAAALQRVGVKAGGYVHDALSSE